MKTKNIVYKQLEQLLFSLGFTPVETKGNHKAYSHPNSKALILLPNYKSTDIINIIHYLTVRRTLKEHDLMDEIAYENWFKHEDFQIKLIQKAKLKQSIPKNVSSNKQSILERKIDVIFSVNQSSLEDIHNIIKVVTESSTNNFLELAKISGLDIQKDLVGAPLHGTDLTGIDLSGANLRFVDLRGANLSHTNLSHTDLRESHIMNANLNRVNLSYANLDEAILNASDLTNANLKGASLQGASLIEAELINLNLSKMNLGNVNFEKANLRGCILSETNLENSIFIEADLTEVDLSKANVKNAQFGDNEGISTVTKHNLIERGAIFEDLSTANGLN